MKGKSLMALIGALLLLSQLPAQETDSPSDNGRESWAEEMFKGPLINAAGEEVAVSSLKGKMVGIYFSASWCPPCRAFTPQLVKFYNQVAKKNGLVIVFASWDKSETDMMEYMKKDSMPFPAVPFGSPVRNELKSKLKITAIPTLVIFGKDGNLITSQGRKDVVILGKEAVKAWKSPDYNPLPLASRNGIDTKQKTGIKKFFDEERNSSRYASRSFVVWQKSCCKSKKKSSRSVKKKSSRK